MDDALFHYHATHIIVLSYFKDSIAGPEEWRFSVCLSYDISLADQKDCGELFGCMSSPRLGLLGQRDIQAAVESEFERNKLEMYVAV